MIALSGSPDGLGCPCAGTGGGLRPAQGVGWSYTMREAPTASSNFKIAAIAIGIGAVVLGGAWLVMKPKGRRR